MSHQTTTTTTPKKRLPIVSTVIALVLIVAGYVTAYSGLVATNGLGMGPHSAAAACVTFGIHTSACGTFNTLNNLGTLLIMAGIATLLGIAIRTAVRFSR